MVGFATAPTAYGGNCGMIVFSALSAAGIRGVITTKHAANHTNAVTSPPTWQIRRRRPRAVSVQNLCPAGGGGHDGSGCQPSGGIKPAGAGGHVSGATQTRDGGLTVGATSDILSDRLAIQARTNGRNHAPVGPEVPSRGLVRAQIPVRLAASRTDRHLYAADYGSDDSSAACLAACSRRSKCSDQPASSSVGRFPLSLLNPAAPSISSRTRSA